MKNMFSLVGRVALAGIDTVNKQLTDAEKSVRKVQATLGRFGNNVAKVGKELTTNLTAPIGAATAAIGLLATKTGDYADKLLTLEQRTGLSTDTLQEFAHVAKTAGGDSDALFATITKLTGQLDEVAKGSGATAEAFNTLGINVLNADGSYRSMEGIFPEVIAGLQGIENQTERNNIAYTIFGGKSKEVAAFLGMTSEKMANTRKEAHALGLVTSREGLDAANNFRIGIENLKAQISALGRDIAVSLMPILNDTFIPLIQSTLIPALRLVGDVITSLGAAFASLPKPIQTVVIIVGALAAALGPLLLIVGKLVVMMAGLPALTAKLSVGLGVAKTAVVALQGAFTKMFAVLLANPIIAVTAAFTALVGVMWKTHEINKKLIEDNAKLKADEDRTRALNAEARAAQNAAAEYAKLRGTVNFNETKMRELSKAHEDATISLKNHSLAMQGKTAMTDVDTEATRRNVQAQHGIIAEARKTEFELAQAAKAEEERQRKREEASKRWFENERKRREELHNLVKEYTEKYDDLFIESEEERLLKQRDAALERLQSLKASEIEMLSCVEYYTEKINRVIDEREQQKIDARDETEKTALDRLKRQSADRLQLLEMDYIAEIIAAEKVGADISAIDKYYAEERAKIEREDIQKREDINREWRDRLLQQSGDRLAIFEAEYASALAEAQEHGADLLQVENYYAEERKRLNAQIEEEITRKAKEESDKRIASYSKWSSEVAGVVNRIGSLFSMASKNEEARLNKQYQDRRDYIEANVVDETERQKQLSLLDEEADKKRLQLQQEQARRDKALGIFNTIIDTAAAIVKALTAGPIAGPILAGIIGALGVAQTAIIASTPEPFYAGGLIKGSTDGVVAQVGERNQDELIMPLDVGINKIVSALAERQGVTNNTASTTVHVHVGTMIADDRGIKHLGRKIREVIINEDRRTGVA